MRKLFRKFRVFGQVQGIFSGKYESFLGTNLFFWVGQLSVTGDRFF